MDVGWPASGLAVVDEPVVLPAFEDTGAFEVAGTDGDACAPARPWAALVAAVPGVELPAPALGALVPPQAASNKAPQQVTTPADMAKVRRLTGTPACSPAAKHLQKRYGRPSLHTFLGT